MGQRGGKREGAGRKSGGVSQAKKDIAQMAKVHAVDALNTLAKIAKSGESESARVSAANALLDRAYGRPMQSHQVTGKDGGPLEHNHKITASDLSDDELANIATAGSK
ncbi:hypothetical protein [Rhizobium sp. NXC24]|uniref:hypothetical protein n=1 Tax=Rhizobium sp. NXC24 TaxID=2048897 RepID=UPI000CDF4D0E|nr:hypothetical protein [Rhizobium sp. NXC24]AVA20666.1 hypothetical protein NXC24_CH00999 [Rhizobium sp. NXC24]